MVQHPRFCAQCNCEQKNWLWLPFWRGAWSRVSSEEPPRNQSLRSLMPAREGKMGNRERLEPVVTSLEQYLSSAGTWMKAYVGSGPFVDCCPRCPRKVANWKKWQNSTDPHRAAVANNEIGLFTAQVVQKNSSNPGLSCPRRRFVLSEGPIHIQHKFTS